METTEIEFKGGEFIIRFNQHNSIESIYMGLKGKCSCELTPDEFMSMNKAFELVQAEINYSNNQIQLFGVKS